MSSFYNDIDPFCCQVLNKNIKLGNLPEGKVDGRDIRTISGDELMEYRHVHLFAGIGGFPLGIARAELDERYRVLSGGFPCQDVSNAGVSNGQREGLDGARSGLWGDMFRLISDLRPDYVCVENVAALLYRGMGRVLGDLAQIGYDAEWQILSAATFGAPHLRERVFIVAYPSSVRLQRGYAQFTVFPQKMPITLTAKSTSVTWRENTIGTLWQSEPDVVRVADGIPRRVDRLRALGNAIVPQCAEYVGRCIMAYEQSREGAA